MKNYIIAQFCLPLSIQKTVTVLDGVSDKGQIISLFAYIWLIADSEYFGLGAEFTVLSRGNVISFLNVFEI